MPRLVGSTVATLLCCTTWALADPLTPDPLAHTAYASERSNKLCWPYLGEADAGDIYRPLPCRPAREEWPKAAMLEQFVISAWWPPTLNVLHEYADAGFNTVLTGNLMGGCQYNGTAPRLATANDTFECIAAILPTIERLGMRAMFNLGGWDSRPVPSDYILGGASSEGGVTDATDPASSMHYLTQPEVAWLVSELERRNLSHIIGALELQDDTIFMGAPYVETIRWVKEHAPSMVPKCNTGSEGSLYASRQPVASPEWYAIDSDTTNATLDTDNQLRAYAEGQVGDDRFRVGTWPLFDLGDEDPSHSHQVISASLLRVQVTRHTSCPHARICQVFGLLTCHGPSPALVLIRCVRAMPCSACRFMLHSHTVRRGFSTTAGPMASGASMPPTNLPHAANRRQTMRQSSALEPKIAWAHGGVSDHTVCPSP